MPPRKILYTAAHGGFDIDRIPLGGAATIATALTRRWSAQNNFAFELLTPDLLGDRAPRDQALVRYSARDYARFCFAFEAATTARIEQADPTDVTVLCNDISEGPDFRRLRRRGYRLFTIYHVDVVDYVARMYLRGAVAPERLTRWHGALARMHLARWMPSVLRLVFDKQRDSVDCSCGVIVPSEGMKQTLLRCYPSTDPGKIHVVPWGLPESVIEEGTLAPRVAALRRHYGIDPASYVLLTLSRISPEKGQDRLLKALAIWERQTDYPEPGLVVFLCGEAAYMQGKTFLRQLKRLAGALKKTRVIFTGYLAAEEKQAHFRLADLYVFPSRHESYGLTLLEAFQAGLPAIATANYGAEGLLKPEFGRLLPAHPARDLPAHLLQALKSLLKNRPALRSMGEKARRFAQTQTFSQAADQLVRILQQT